MPIASPAPCAGLSDETDRRRSRQSAFNLAHGIVPRGVHKDVRELIDGIVGAADSAAPAQIDTQPSYLSMSERQLGREIKRLEKQMLDLSKNLQFEKAAQVRDQLAVLRGRVFGLDTGGKDGQDAELGQAA